MSLQEKRKEEENILSKFEELRNRDYELSENPKVLPEVSRDATYSSIKPSVQLDTIKDYARLTDKYDVPYRYKPKYDYSNYYKSNYDRDRYNNYYSNDKNTYNPLSKIMTALEDKSPLDNRYNRGYQDNRYQNSRQDSYQDRYQDTRYQDRYKNIGLGNPYERIQESLARGRHGYDGYRQLPSASSRLPSRVGYRQYGRLPVTNLKERDVETVNKEGKLKKKKEKKPENKKKRTRTRVKRHLGPHDEGGLQRLISTGKLCFQLSTKVL